jgi:circadian clock protein KaiB
VALARKRRAALVLRLYVAGNAPNSLLAMTNAKMMCDRHFAFQHELEVIDVLDHPARALADRIIVTPTLLRLFPLPVQRVIGNLNDVSGLLLTLGSK